MRHETDELDRTLRVLDPALPPVDPTSPRARADLARILAADPGRPQALPAARRPRRQRRVVRRLLALGALTAAVAGVVIAVPSVTGGDRAFASWTPSGTAVPAGELDDTAERCRDALSDAAGSDGAALAAAVPAVAETRGAWTTVLLIGDSGFSALCITDGTTRLFDDSIGSIGHPDVPAATGTHDVVATDLGSGTTRAGELSLAAGTVGPDVTGVSYDSPVHGRVRATVRQGHFAFWLPGDELEDASRDGVLLDVVHDDGRRTVVRVSL